MKTSLSSQRVPGTRDTGHLAKENSGIDPPSSSASRRAPPTERVDENEGKRRPRGMQVRAEVDLKT